MPIIPSIDTTPISQEAFGKLAVHQTFRKSFFAYEIASGSGLELAHYEEAITHFLGGESAVLAKIPVAGKAVNLPSRRCV
jgi:hypothetical protein